jgi:hypothetical protein
MVGTSLRRMEQETDRCPPTVRGGSAASRAAHGREADHCELGEALPGGGIASTVHRVDEQQAAHCGCRAARPRRPVLRCEQRTVTSGADPAGGGRGGTTRPAHRLPSPSP